MNDNRQIAFGLALGGGLLALGSAVFSLLAFFFAASAFGLAFGSPWMDPVFGGMAGFFAAFIAFGLITQVVGGVVLLVGAPRLRDEDREARRTWGVWCAVAGGAILVGGGLISGGLGLGAGIVTLVADQQQA